MTAAHRRGARRELEAARVLGSTRVLRRRGERAQDVATIRHEIDGTLVVPEVKTRSRRCALVENALGQAAGYVPGCVPLAVISSTGGRAIGCMFLDDLARLVGLRAPKAGEQLVLLGGPVR